MKLILALSLAMAVGLCVASALPGGPTPTDPCEQQKKKCTENAVRFGRGLFRSLKECRALRRCKRVCRQEKRDAKRDCRHAKRDCRSKCHRDRKGRSCRKNCRQAKRRCARDARKTKRVCRNDCRKTYKTPACKKARNGILTSGLKTIPACAGFLLCSSDDGSNQ